MNIFFLYSQPRKSWLQAVRLSRMPDHVMYGLTKLPKHKYTTSISDKGFAKTNLWRWIASPIQQWFLKQSGVGFQIDQLIPLVSKLQQVDAIVATNDSCGLPLAWLKQLGVIKTPQLYCHISFEDTFSSQGKSTLRKLLNYPEKIICFSASEVSHLQREFQVARKRIAVVPPGVDTRYFHPQVSKSLFDIVAVGRDTHRDYVTLLLASSRLALKTLIVCDPKNVVGLPIPENIVIKYRQAYNQMRIAYHHAKIIVIPVVKNSVNGQISLLEALSCGKPVIAARNPALVNTFGLVHGKHCLLYTPESVNSLEKQLDILMHNTRLRDRLSKHARAKAKEFSSTKFATNLTAAVNAVLVSQS